jgi:tRNA uridine 5-carboxymethylaminomethyl modification enzyme
LVDEERWGRFERKQRQKERLLELFSQVRVTPDAFPGIGMSADDRPLLAVWLRRPEARIVGIRGWIEASLGEPLERGLLETIETSIKYGGYLEQQERQISRLRESGGRVVPTDLDYRSIPGLSREVAERFERVRPSTLGQAARIPGITPAAVAVLDIYLSRDKSAANP